MALIGLDDNLPKIFRSGVDDTDDIIELAREINRRAVEMTENGGKSMHIGPYLLHGMTREEIKITRGIFNSTHS